MRGSSKTRSKTAGDHRSVNARSSINSDKKSCPSCRTSLVDLGRYIRDAFASSEDPPGLESLDQHPVEPYFRKVRYLSVDIDAQSAAAYWRVFVTIAGCMLVGCSCSYGLPSDTGGGVQDTHVSASGNGDSDTDGGTTGAGESGLTDRSMTGTVVPDGERIVDHSVVSGNDGGAERGIIQDTDGSDTDDGEIDGYMDDMDGSVNDSNTDVGTIDNSEQTHISASDENDCCSAHAVGGCANINVQTCICEVDPECCQQSWDMVCVELISLIGCGSCAQPTRDCCTASQTVGCSDPAIQACVCVADRECCNQEWDEFCVLLVDQLGCGICG